MTITRILLVDDHDIVRMGIRRLLEAEHDICVVGEASDGFDAIRMTRQLKPDLLILDLMMPGIGGIEVLRRNRAHSSETRSIILSMHSNEAYVIEALKSGADGYVLKGSSGRCLIEAIRTVSAGRRYLSPPLSQESLDAYASSTTSSAADLYETLTDREREVFSMAVMGRSSREIGSLLKISPRTVEVHRGNIMRKLCLHNQSELVHYAILKGILPLQNRSELPPVT